MSSILKDITKKEQKRIENPDRHENIKAGQKDFRTFCNLRNPEFYKSHRKYQDVLCNTMQDMYEGKYKNPKTGKPKNILVVQLPPGFGKSYTAQNFEEWFFGQDVKNKVISISYNQDLADEFSRGVRDAIEDEEILDDDNYYTVRSFFPSLELKQGDSSVKKWALEGSYKSYIAAGFDGTITGMRANLLVIDDPIKNYEESVNDKVKEKHYKFWKNTSTSRCLPGALQIIIQTAWASDDLAGRIVAEHPDRCHVLKMKAIQEDETSLCEDLYPIADLNEKKEAMDEDVFEANFQQEPIDKKGALYEGFRTWDYLPDDHEMRLAYIDTADTGADYLMCIGGRISNLMGYVTDIYYNDDSMETTEKDVAAYIVRNDIRVCVVESNNGGRGFARSVEKILLQKYRFRKCKFIWLHQSKNKNTRILTNSSNVTNQLLFPPDWARRFPKYYLAMTKYQRKGKNAHDDAPDGTTGLVECINGDVKVKKGTWGLRT